MDRVLTETVNPEILISPDKSELPRKISKESHFEIKNKRTFIYRLSTTNYFLYSPR